VGTTDFVEDFLKQKAPVELLTPHRKTERSRTERLSDQAPAFETSDLSVVNASCTCRSTLS
jgi:hypothetical protein